MGDGEFALCFPDCWLPDTSKLEAGDPSRRSLLAEGHTETQLTRPEHRLTGIKSLYTKCITQIRNEVIANMSSHKIPQGKMGSEGFKTSQQGLGCMVWSQ